MSVEIDKGGLLTFELGHVQELLHVDPGTSAGNDTDF